MKALNTQLPLITTSKIRQFDAWCSRFEGVIKLTLGQPLFPTPSPIKAKAKEAIDRDITRYTPNVGAAETIDSVLQYCRERLNLHYGHDEILITVGSSEALTASLRSLLNAGDEVLIPTPAYPGYEPLINLYNASAVHVDTRSDRFELTPETLQKYITPRTKCLIITDPNNPTGILINRKNRDRLADFLAETDLYIIADEVYNRIIYTDDYRSFGTYEKLRKQLIIVNSFSKSHSMTGWRIGFLLAERNLTKELMKSHQYYVTSACSVTQYAIQAINDAQTERELAAMVRDYRACRDYACRCLNEYGFTTPQIPQGAFYLFVSVDKFGLDGDSFARRLVEEQGVAIIPGSAFSDSYKNYVRISYCVDFEILKKAMEKIKIMVTNLMTESINR
ncbi:MAG: aminotransferase class I/II-fold pyridoxal phosphate-dependent enzyme [Prevotellaceae bacterium]|jgi:aminotransferase|nr:aminotransferase class I/II-fold pyridoxal phosphate-dependent enzyme [Prevotellaceae bacterium]